MRFCDYCFILEMTTLMACAPADKVPISGNITMEYTGTAQTGARVTLTLANGTAQPIYFRGNPDPSPGKLIMLCDSAREAMAFGQGSTEPALKDKIIEVKSGERLQTSLWLSLPLELKSQKPRCHLKLTLEGGLIVESREFTP